MPPREARPSERRDEAWTLDFAAELWALLRTFERTSTAASRAAGVTGEQLLLLRIAGRYEWITPARLARIVCRDTPGVRAEIGSLASAGFVTLRRTQEARGLVVSLTAAGLRLALWDPGSVEAAMGSVLRATNDDVVASTRRLLLALRGALARHPTAKEAARRPPAPRRTRIRVSKPA